MKWYNKLTLPSTAETTRLTPSEVKQLKAEAPNLPPAYYEFLEHVGWGDIGPMMVYSGPIEPDEFFSNPSPAIARTLLFADNFQGYFYAFDLGDGGRVVEVAPSREISRDHPAKFEEFVCDSLQHFRRGT